METVAVDIGGTNTRFAIAEIVNGRVYALHYTIIMKAAEHASFQLAWQAYAERTPHDLPRAAAIAVACPVSGTLLKLTNNSWIIQPAQIPEALNVEAWTLVNDFGAIGHAAAHVGEDQLAYVSGPEQSLPENGVTTIIGAGTGLGVAHVLRRDGRYHVIECEGGHIDFAPLDDLDNAILGYLRRRYPRVSVERLVSGPGLVNIYEALAAIEGKSHKPMNDKDLWEVALAGSDRLAAAALARFCLSLGSMAGDIALAHGANAVILAGGIAPRIAHLLRSSGFAERFTAKGRFESMMTKIPVRLMTHPQPGLFGAAAAFAEEHRSS